MFPLHRPGLFPGGRCRAVPPARARPGRDAHRGDASALRPGRADDPRDRSRRRKSRSILDNIGLPDTASTSPTATPPRSARPTAKSWSRSTPKITSRPVITSTRCAASCRKQLPAGHVLLPAGRHRHPDPELRSARADRHSDHRAADRDEPTTIAQRDSQATSPRFPARWTCTCTRSDDAGAARRRRSHAGQPDRA